MLTVVLALRRCLPATSDHVSARSWGRFRSRYETPVTISAPYCLSNGQIKSSFLPVFQV